MAKRYHDGRKSELEKHEYYAGEKARRHEEMRDAGMISEDHSAIANMPQNVVMRPYEKGYGYMPENLDDTIRGIDAQIGMDDSKRRQHNVPKKV